MLPQDSNQSKLSEKEVFNELANSLGHCFIQIGETLRRAEYSPNLLHHFLQTSNSLTNSLIFPPRTQDFSKKEEKLSSLSQNQKNTSNHQIGQNNWNSWSLHQYLEISIKHLPDQNLC